MKKNNEMQHFGSKPEEAGENGALTPPKGERNLETVKQKLSKEECPKKDNSSKAQVRTIFMAKETSLYRIVTDDSNDWHLVANRAIDRNELLIFEDVIVDVKNIDFVDIVLEETQERKRVYKAVSAVPSNASCEQDALEIPWCFMNHSCDPNTMDQWEGMVHADLDHAETIAIKDISEGEKLTYDYDREHFNYKSPFECSCGTESCRSKIQGFKSLSNEQKSRLLSTASPFVQEKHRRSLIAEHTYLSPRGRHVVIDYWDCDADLLNNEGKLRELLAEAAIAAKAEILSVHSHQFSPEGVTVVAILAESHISIHTWPLSGYAGVDIYTCGNCDPLEAHKKLYKSLFSGRTELVELHRGGTDSPQSITAVPEESLVRSGLADDAKSFVEGFLNVSHVFQISQVVCKGRTRFQEYLIFDNPAYGRILVLDGIVQLSTLDEHIYHEMLVHPPMFAHPKPKRVCIVGGGDGGTLREILKHDPEEVVMIDIDEEFVRTVAKHIPSVNNGAFDDPRVKFIFEDANKALERFEDAFDVAIIDCNDEVGPSAALFEGDFYAKVSRALKDEAVCAVQVGSMLEPTYIQKIRNRMKTHLGNTVGFKLTMPSYHCGEYFFAVASKRLDSSGPEIKVLEELQEMRGINTKYWSPLMHHASQVFPSTHG